jgi:hypothetical protein
VAQPLPLDALGGLAGGKGGGGGAPTVVSCSTPGVAPAGSIGNYKTNCHGTGRPVNETTIATNGSLFVAGANDYNSHNGIVQDGFYWSSDAKTWSDAGPINVFPQQRYNAAGDPGVAVDANGVAYYRLGVPVPGQASDRARQRPQPGVRLLDAVPVLLRERSSVPDPGCDLP